MLALWFACARLARAAALEVERESAAARLGLALMALGAAEWFYALPVLGAATARVLVGALFASMYAGWASTPVVHGAYANVIAMSIVPRGDRYRVVGVESDAMAPAIGEGSLAIVDLSAYASRDPRVGDIVAIVLPPDRAYLKRLVALPGDAFEVTDGDVRTNGRRPPGWHNRAFAGYVVAVVHESIVVDGVPLDRSIANVPPPSEWADPSRLPADCYFVLGDNVNDSEDSHDFGCVQRGAIVGEVLAAL